MLLDHRDSAINRFDRRGGESDWDTHNRAVVAGSGGAVWLGGLYDPLADVVARRPDAVVVHSELAAIEGTYAAMMDALRGPRA